MTRAEALLTIDWRQVVLDLRRHHYRSAATLAREVGSNERHIQALARGDVAEPRISTGLRLLDLHHDHCPGLTTPRRLLTGARAA